MIGSPHPFTFNYTGDTALGEGSLEWTAVQGDCEKTEEALVLDMKS